APVPAAPNLPASRPLSTACALRRRGLSMYRPYAQFAFFTLALLLTGARSDAAPLVSGVETQYFDDAVPAQQDFYEHANGKWLAATTIPPDKASYGPANQLFDETQERLRTIIQEAAQST